MRNINDKYKVIKDGHFKFHLGDVVYLKDDDDSENPWFGKSVGHDPKHTNSYPVTISRFLKKVEEKEMTKFKKGDKVRLKEDYSSKLKGYEFVIDSVLNKNHNTGEYLVYGGGIVVYARRLELVQEHKVTRENLNVHTIYEIVESNSCFPKGTLVRLLEVPEDPESFKAYKLDTSDYFWYSYRDIKIHGTEDKVNEYTLEQIAEKFGVDVKSVRIKE